MSNRIKISPQQVRGVANQFKNSSSESQTMVDRLSTTIRAIEGDWEGLTKEHFYQQFTEWKKTMSQFVIMLDDINKQLLKIADKFEAVDKERF